MYAIHVATHAYVSPILSCVEAFEFRSNSIATCSVHALNAGLP
jgi:hypothetical protein